LKANKFKTSDPERKRVSPAPSIPPLASLTERISPVVPHAQEQTVVESDGITGLSLNGVRKLTG
jgi:hypothetical protein